MLDMNARYAVRGWDGIAFFVHGFPKVWEPEVSVIDDHDTGDTVEFNTGEGEWIAQDESCGRVIVVMVGDDQKREVDVEDLTPLGEDYCRSCGQTGCTADGR